MFPFLFINDGDDDDDDTYRSNIGLKETKKQ